MPVKISWTPILKKLEEFKIPQEFTFSELFDVDFMEKYTQFSSLELMLEQSGFSIESSEDFLSIPINDLDKVINEKTSFSSWEEMKITATKRLLQMKLSLG